MDRRADLALAVAVVGYGAVLLFLTTRLESGVYFDPVGKQGLPYLVGGALVAMGSLLIIRRLVSWGAERTDMVYAEGSEDEAGQPASALRAVAVMGLTIAYLATWAPLGFLIATPLYLLATLLVLGVRSIPGLVLGPIVYAAVAFLVFSEFLSVPLPVGPLEGLLAAIVTE